MTDASSQEHTAADAQVRHAIYRHIIAQGVVPGAADLAQALGETDSHVEASLLRLAAQHRIALAPGTLNIWMAHPFSAVPTAYPVHTLEHTYWANCAWDALAIPVVLGGDSHTSTICADCGHSLEIVVEGGEARSEASVVHFGVGPKRFWDNVGFT